MSLYIYIYKDIVFYAVLIYRIKNISRRLIMFMPTTAKQLHKAVYNHRGRLPQASSFFGQLQEGIRQRKTQHWLCQKCAIVGVRTRC